MFQLIFALIYVLLFTTSQQEFIEPWLDTNIHALDYSLCAVFTPDAASVEQYLETCNQNVPGQKQYTSLENLHEYLQRDSANQGNSNANNISDSRNTSADHKENKVYFLNDLQSVDAVVNLTFFGISSITIKADVGFSEIRFYSDQRIHILNHSVSALKPELSQISCSIRSDGTDKYALIFDEELEPGEILIQFVFKSHLDLLTCGDGSQCDIFGKVWSRDTNGHPFITTNGGGKSLFPCLDEPSFKARYAIHVGVPTDMEVVSIGEKLSVIDIVDNSNGSIIGRCHKFYSSDIIPPWSPTIVVGRLISSEPKLIGSTQWSITGLLHNVPNFDTQPVSDDMEPPADYAFNRQSEKLIQYISKFYNQAEKLLDVKPSFTNRINIVIIPNKLGGGMSLPGLVLIDEAFGWIGSLLQGVESETTRLRGLGSNVTTQGHVHKLYELMSYLGPTLNLYAHELAHQWFGNLVTHKWWNDLWLTEAMSELIGSDTIAALEFPFSSYGYFNSFAQKLDAMNSKFPVARREIRLDGHFANIFNFGVYYKGAHTLKMLRSVIGKDAFYDGIKLYLNKHAKGSAVTQDLLNAWQVSINRHVVYGPGGQLLNVTEFLSPWLYSQSVPIVSVTETKTHLELQQHSWSSANLTNSSLVPMWNTPLQAVRGKGRIADLFTVWLPGQKKMNVNVTDQDFIFLHDNPDMFCLVQHFDYTILAEHCHQFNNKALLAYIVNWHHINNREPNHGRIRTFLAYNHLQYLVKHLEQKTWSCHDIVDLHQRWIASS